MTTTAWAHLPNAAHVDRVLASLKKNPEKWDAAHTVTWDAARDAARSKAWIVARDAAQDAARDAARDAAWGVARGAARGAVLDAAWSVALDATRDTALEAALEAAWDATLVLIAWDDCAYMLELPEDVLKVLRAVGNEQAILLSAAANILKETS